MIKNGYRYALNKPLSIIKRVVEKCKDISSCS